MRRLSWLLWLLIALMPVRGIAQSLMAASPVPTTAVAEAGTDPAPCAMHASTDTDEGGAPHAHDDNQATGAHACSLCNVCHSAMLPLAFAVQSASALPGAEPVPAHGLGAGRAAPADLFRPPR